MMRRARPVGGRQSREQLVQRSGVAAVLRRSSRTAVGGGVAGPSAAVLPEDAMQWSWPPYAPVQTERESFDTDEWAPPSVVWHPQLRVGRWTVLYRRSGS